MRGAPMTSWTDEELERIGEAQELQLASERPDGTLRPYVTMWVVRVDRRTVRTVRVRREQPVVPAGEGERCGSHPGRWRGAGRHVRRARFGRSPRHRRHLSWEVRPVRPRDRRNRGGISRPRGDDQARAAFDELGMDAQRNEREQRVTPLELFFDLVVVFAFTQVTQLMSDDLTWRGVGRGLLVLAAIWWAWTGYAWLTNALEPRRARSARACSVRWLRCSSSPSPSRARSEPTPCCSGSPTCSCVCSISCSTRSPAGATPTSFARSSGSHRRPRSGPCASCWPGSSTAARRRRSGASGSPSCTGEP